MRAVAPFDSAGMSADPRSLDRLRAGAAAQSPAATKAVAQQFEALLLQQMLTAMRKSVPQNELEQGVAGDTFRAMRDQQWATTWAQNGGIGFANTIVKQLEIQRNPALLKEVATSPLAGQLLPQLRKPAVQLAGGISARAAKPAAEVAPLAATPAVSGKVDAQAGGAASTFLDKLGEAAKTTAQALGLSPHLLLAHAALETGWGRKNIKTADGGDSHNLFGIKAGAGWQGKTVDVLTTEYVDGIAQKRIEKFRAYDSYGDALADYAGLLKRRYGDALAQGNSALGFAQALANGGYATDPQYVQKLTRVADRVAAHLGMARSS
ncbi:flagellar assembly peptidoglycan hydrolase FlgJ [Chitinibacter tainanensis]|uniref:flagellar assembly peptidoglycan hydrolase FlgJ n=1 Tax=Chitinibacter tainanensis TaxID=230667 RepID=UPI00040AE548|nr:flagellar assembly peptidoglycan hydrolase FlgJ [Chitinibacter tainanensis]